MLPIGKDQCGVQGENQRHDEQVARHHENSPHQHPEGIRKGHEGAKLFAAREDEKHGSHQLHSADEGEEELGLQHGHHECGGLRFGVACGHDGGVGQIDIVEVLQA